MLTINEDNRLKSSQSNTNLKAFQSGELNSQIPLHRLKASRERRNAVSDTSTNALTPGQNYCYHQLAERVRELEKEIVPDFRFYQVPSVYSSYSALTPCSNISEGGNSTYAPAYTFPLNLVSPNSSATTQQYGLSSKILERAHEIPTRFWVDWQQKQMQNRIEELEYIKNNLISPTQVHSATVTRRKSLLSLHNGQRRVSFPRCTTFKRDTSTSIDNETPSSSAVDQQSVENSDIDHLNISSPAEPITPIPSTLDRSRLTIFFPFSHLNVPEQSMAANDQHAQPNNTQESVVPTMSSAPSIEDVAQIDTELYLTLLSRENKEQNNPLLYSRAVVNRTVEFRSSSLKKDLSRNQNERSV